MNDETPKDPFTSNDKTSRARERMSADYDDAPRRSAPPVGKPAEGGVVSQALGQFLNSDAGTRRLVYGAAGLGTVLLVGIGGWALLGHHQSGIPVLGPPAVSMRTKPVDPGGMQLDGVTMPEADDGQAHPVPAPEKPNPKGLAAQYGQEAAKTDAAENAAKPPAPTPATPTTPEATAPAQGDDKTASAPAPATSADDTQQPTTLPEAGTGSEDNSAAGDSEAASTPAAPAPAPAKPAAKKPVAEAPAKPATPEKPEAPSAVAGGKYRVQLAALQSEAQAMQEWSRLKTRYPTLFGDRTPVIEKIVRDNAVFYRLRVGGFASIADTRAFCGAVRDRGLACAQVHQ